MGGLVEKQVVDVLEVLLYVDFVLVEKVLIMEDWVDDLEIQIDEECVCVLVLCQLVVLDLWLIIVVFKVVLDLECIGDEFVKIVVMVLQLVEDGELLCGYVEVWYIGNYVCNMLCDVLDVFVCFDVDKVVEVVVEDIEVDLEYCFVMCVLVIFMMEDLCVIFRVFNIIWFLCVLECIGDYVCNIGEQVIFLVKGIDVCYIFIDEMEKEVCKKD